MINIKDLTSAGDFADHLKASQFTYRNGLTSHPVTLSYSDHAFSSAYESAVKHVPNQVEELATTSADSLSLFSNHQDASLQASGGFGWLRFFGEQEEFIHQQTKLVVDLLPNSNQQAKLLELYQLGAKQQQALLSKRLEVTSKLHRQMTDTLLGSCTNVGGEPVQPLTSGLVASEVNQGFTLAATQQVPSFPVEQSDFGQSAWVKQQAQLGQGPTVAKAPLTTESDYVFLDKQNLPAPPVKPNPALVSALAFLALTGQTADYHKFSVAPDTLQLDANCFNFFKSSKVKEAEKQQCYQLICDLHKWNQEAFDAPACVKELGQMLLSLRKQQFTILDLADQQAPFTQILQVKEGLRRITAEIAAICGDNLRSSWLKGYLDPKKPSPRIIVKQPLLPLPDLNTLKMLALKLNTQSTATAQTALSVQDYVVKAASAETLGSQATTSAASYESAVAEIIASIPTLVAKAVQTALAKSEQDQAKSEQNQAKSEQDQTKSGEGNAEACQPEPTTPIGVTPVIAPATAPSVASPTTPTAVPQTQQPSGTSETSETGPESTVNPLAIEAFKRADQSTSSLAEPAQIQAEPVQGSSLVEDDVSASELGAQQAKPEPKVSDLQALPDEQTKVTTSVSLTLGFSSELVQPSASETVLPAGSVSLEQPLPEQSSALTLADDESQQKPTTGFDLAQEFSELRSAGKLSADSLIELAYKIPLELTQEEKEASDSSTALIKSFTVERQTASLDLKTFSATPSLSSVSRVVALRECKLSLQRIADLTNKLKGLDLSTLATIAESSGTGSELQSDLNIVSSVFSILSKLEHLRRVQMAQLILEPYSFVGKVNLGRSLFEISCKTRYEIAAELSIKEARLKVLGFPEWAVRYFFDDGFAESFFEKAESVFIRLSQIRVIAPQNEPLPLDASTVEQTQVVQATFEPNQPGTTSVLTAQVVAPLSASSLTLEVDADKVNTWQDLSYLRGEREKLELYNFLLSDLPSLTDSSQQDLIAPYWEACKQLTKQVKADFAEREAALINYCSWRICSHLHAIYMGLPSKSALKQTLTLGDKKRNEISTWFVSKYGNQSLAKKFPKVKLSNLRAQVNAMCTELEIHVHPSLRDNAQASVPEAKITLSQAPANTHAQATLPESAVLTGLKQLIGKTKGLETARLALILNWLKSLSISDLNPLEQQYLHLLVRQMFKEMSGIPKMARSSDFAAYAKELGAFQSQCHKKLSQGKTGSQLDNYIKEQIAHYEQPLVSGQASSASAKTSQILPSTSGVFELSKYGRKLEGIAAKKLTCNEPTIFTKALDDLEEMVAKANNKTDQYALLAFLFLLYPAVTRERNCDLSENSLAEAKKIVPRVVQLLTQAQVKFTPGLSHSERVDLLNKLGYETKLPKSSPITEEVTTSVSAESTSIIKVRPELKQLAEKIVLAKSLSEFACFDNFEKLAKVPQTKAEVALIQLKINHLQNLIESPKADKELKLAAVQKQLVNRIKALRKLLKPLGKKLPAQVSVTKPGVAKVKKYQYHPADFSFKVRPVLETKSPGEVASEQAQLDSAAIPVLVQQALDLETPIYQAISTEDVISSTSLLQDLTMLSRAIPDRLDLAPRLGVEGQMQEQFECLVANLNQLTNLRCWQLNLEQCRYHYSQIAKLLNLSWFDMSGLDKLYTTFRQLQESVSAQPDVIVEHGLRASFVELLMLKGLVSHMRSLPGAHTLGALVEYNSAVASKVLRACEAFSKHPMYQAWKKEATFKRVLGAYVYRLSVTDDFTLAFKELALAVLSDNVALALQLAATLESKYSSVALLHAPGWTSNLDVATPTQTQEPTQTTVDKLEAAIADAVTKVLTLTTSTIDHRANLDQGLSAEDIKAAADVAQAQNPESASDLTEQADLQLAQVSDKPAQGVEPEASKAKISFANFVPKLKPFFAVNGKTMPANSRTGQSKLEFLPSDPKAASSKDVFCTDLDEIASATNTDVVADANEFKVPEGANQEQVSGIDLFGQSTSEELVSPASEDADQAAITTINFREANSGKTDLDLKLKVSPVLATEI